ncbi:hypothetical protein HPB47_026694 [Ixodes persulcatus]|uniref:Uncharacterized protein n=1 Tax=Ixodes persulcatus TaxID=34615 RepID=A0AC60PY87_IXOPE|nr:hypothetical protein HPB47_026694 [Ixodes persulcatus]
MSNNVGLGSREWFHFYNLIIPWRLFNFLLHFFDFCGEEIYQCMTVCEGNLEEMDDNAALANEFELTFSDLTPTELEMLLRTHILWIGALRRRPRPATDSLVSA